MEYLQMLKFALKKAHLNFTGGWITYIRKGYGGASVRPEPSSCIVCGG
jgi:hypothetical protein